MEMGLTHMSITSLLFKGNSFTSTGDLNSRDLGTSDILFFFFCKGKRSYFIRFNFLHVWH